MTIHKSKDEIQSIMDGFSAAVNNKQYEKMSYQYWKCLARADTLDITYSDHIITLRINYPFKDNTLTLPSNDKSFGEYLYNEYFTATTQFVVPDVVEDSFYDKCLANYIKLNNIISTNDNYSNRVITGPSALVAKMTGTSDSLVDKINEIVDKKLEERKEPNKNMKNFNFDFGPCSGENIKMSIYGLAIKNKAGTWVSYNSATNQIVDVDIMNFDGAKYMYKIPVALNAVHVGDIIIHNRYPMFVTEVNPSTNVLGAIDVCEGEVKKIIPTTNMFGFNFITKVVSLFDMGNVNPSPENPFGSNILPYLMLANKNDSDASDNINFRDMLIFSNFMNGSNSYALNNPAMMYFLMSDKNDNDMLPLMFMMNQGNFNFGGHSFETPVMTSYKNYGNSYKMEDDDVEK